MRHIFFIIILLSIPALVFSQELKHSFSFVTGLQMVENNQLGWIHDDGETLLQNSYHKRYTPTIGIHYKFSPIEVVRIRFGLQYQEKGVKEVYREETNAYVNGDGQAEGISVKSIIHHHYKVLSYPFQLEIAPLTGTNTFFISAGFSYDHLLAYQREISDEIVGIGGIKYNRFVTDNSSIKNSISWSLGGGYERAINKHFSFFSEISYRKYDWIKPIKSVTDPLCIYQYRAVGMQFGMNYTL